MKTLAKIAMIVLMSTGSWMLPQKASAQFPGISFQVFYDQLSPYGAWVDDPNYGYVWIPDETAGFYPYGTNGHWVLTVFGWTWVSDYPWGWAPFHYGRWNLDPYYGWIWIPGNEWGPAWVTWRRCNDYYGWAPLGPGITIQMSFNVNFYLPDDRWMFVRDRDFDRADLDRHFIGRRENHDLIRNSRAIKNTRIDNSRKVTYVTGPDAKEVRNITGRNIKPLPITENNQPGKTVVGNDKVQIYKPMVTRENGQGHKTAPGSIVSREKIKPVTERTKGDLIRSDSKTNLRTGKEQPPSEKKTVLPKYERTDKSNQLRKQQPPIETRDREQINPKRTEQPPIETRNREQINPKRTEQPPIETRNREQTKNKRTEQPPIETRNREQSNMKHNVKPPVETRTREQSNQKRVGTSDKITQPVQKENSPKRSNEKVEPRRNAGTATERNEKGESPRRSN